MKKDEYFIQRAVIEWARWEKYDDGKVADYLHHSPNGGYRLKSQGTQFKLMGTLAGFPDLFLFIAKGGYHGLFIEMKSDKGKLSDNQNKMLQRLEKQGYRCAVCHKATQAIQLIKSYLDDGENEC